MAYTINEITKALGLTGRIESNDRIDELVIDSRKLNFPETSLFFALKGGQQDGHRYILELYQKGVRYFVVSESIDSQLYQGAGFIEVENTLNALQMLAAFHRKKFSYPVIAITGSNGKTIVKEWLFQLLNYDYNIVRSPKSYNSQVGVPLSVWQMDIENQLAVFEAGISLPGEMKILQSIIDPTIGIFTFLGEAHAEGFSSRNQKITEKLQLFARSNFVFYCADEKEVHTAIQNFKTEMNPGLQLYAWGTSGEVYLKINGLKPETSGSVVSCFCEQASHDFFIPFTDEASLHNAFTCMAVLFYFEIPAAQIRERLLQLRPVEMRLELKTGINRCALINDSYSADINSLTIALNFLAQQQQHAHRTVILSDFFQSGQADEVLYKNIAAILKLKKLFRFIGIGPKLLQYSSLFKGVGTTHFYSTTNEFLQHISSLHFQDETILLKGARVFQFEKIGKVLEQKMHQTVLEIDLNALRHNIKIYRRRLNQGVKLMCMVKAFSYGSGSAEIASLLQHAGVDYLGVAYAD
ncbi:MAG: alanine racemase, partial [Gloeobacteraceae cyanobacterium ES-bin-316]|nr:alanine racemase [Ferruginibacter sp.]